MKPPGWRKKEARREMQRALAERLRREEEKLRKKADEQIPRPAPRDKVLERTITFDPEMWQKVHEIAALRKTTARHAISEAITVWRLITEEVEGSDNVRFVGRGGRMMTLTAVPQDAAKAKPAS